MKHCIVLLVYTGVCIVLSACTERNFAPPACRNTEITNQTQRALMAQASNAACVSRVGEHLLVVKRPSGLYDLPYSKKLSDNAQNQLDMSLQCQAHQAMWHQSGFNTKVGDLLGVHSQRHTALFACELDAGFDGTEGELPAPPWNSTEITQLVFIKPFEIEHDQWEDPDRFTDVRDAFVNLSQLSQIHPISTSD